MMRLAPIAALLVCLLLVGAAQAADPTGTWKWTVTRGNNNIEQTLKLKLEGDKLTGVMVGRNNMETKIEDATFKSDEVSFKVTTERQGQKRTTKYTGKLTGDVIKGKIETDRGGQTMQVDWEAKRAKDA